MNQIIAVSIQIPITLFQKKAPMKRSVKLNQKHEKQTQFGEDENSMSDYLDHALNRDTDENITD